MGLSGRSESFGLDWDLGCGCASTRWRYLLGLVSYALLCHGMVWVFFYLTDELGMCYE